MKDVGNELFIKPVPFLRCLGEFIPVCTIRIGVSFKNDRSLVGRKPEVYPSIVADLKDTIYFLADAICIPDNRRIKLGKAGRDLPLLVPGM
jgi:hypothetical protein